MNDVSTRAYEVERWHIGRPARLRIPPAELPRLQLLWLRIAMQPGGRRMREIGELMALANHVSSDMGHAMAWTVYLSLRSRHLADGTTDPRSPLMFFPTELGRVRVIEAGRDAA